MPVETHDGPPPVLTPSTRGLRRVSDLLKTLPEGTPARSTISIWINSGVDGVRLPALRIGRFYYSTRRAVLWFFINRNKKESGNA